MSVLYSRDEMRRFAAELREAHDAAKQGDVWIDRCSLCHATRHPCDVYDLASMVLALTKQETT